MENNIKHDKTLQVIQRIIENPLLHLPFAENMISAMKPVLQKNSIDAYPILCLIGPPESGKSTIAKRIVIDRHNSTSNDSDNNVENRSFYIITDISISNLKKILRNRPDDYVVLDDFAAFHDSDTRRKANRFLDEVVRPSYAGTSALLLLTAESGAFNQITDSLHSRMIKLPMDKYWKRDPVNKQLSEDLLYIRQSLSSLLQDFAEWSLKQDIDIRSRYLHFQQKHQGTMDDRSISLFFTFDCSMEEFSRFLAENYGTSFSMDIFRSSYMSIWKKNQLRSLNNAALVKYLFKKILEDGAFECKIPMTKQLCKHYCDGTCCTENICHCQSNAADCVEDEYSYIDGNYYDPYELIMENNLNSAILITNSDNICGMPAYKKLSVPLFIVGKNNLINMLNNALEKFCIEMKVSHASFGPREISSLLKENKMCVQRVSGDHFVCTFPYVTSDEKTNSVYILRITREEYRSICSKNQKKEKPSFSNYIHMSSFYERFEKNDRYERYDMMPQKLIQLCKELEWWYEDTDSYAKEKYTDITP